MAAQTDRLNQTLGVATPKKLMPNKGKER